MSRKTSHEEKEKLSQLHLGTSSDELLAIDKRLLQRRIKKLNF